MTTLLIAEHDNKSLKDATAKAVTATKALGADVHVLVAGKDCKGAADAAAKLDGVKKVLVADAAPYEHQLAEPLAALIVSLAGNYDAIVAPATTTGKNVMPRVAALLDVMSDRINGRNGRMRRDSECATAMAYAMPIPMRSKRNESAKQSTHMLKRGAECRGMVFVHIADRRIWFRLFVG